MYRSGFKVSMCNEPYSFMINLFSLSPLFILDPLSLFFLCVIGIVSLPSAVYAFGYFKGEYSRRTSCAGFGLMAVFIVSMAGVVTSRNALVFLIFWELMSLVSYFLVVLDHQHDRAVRAGTLYIIMTHIGTACIIAAFLLMYTWAQSWDVFAFRQAVLAQPVAMKNLIFLLLFVGFGTKAGVVPLHIWLPIAHPQAPSPISSLMSGVMIKMGIYGILRFAVFTLGVESLWWGNFILVLAALSCVVGVVYALMENDIKRLLAYSSVENIGIILLGVGASMVFMKMNLPVAAAFALAAGLFHLMNHAVFKALLFLGAGSVYKATGVRSMEKLGGLIKTMPLTAGVFLVGAMAISALPPLNGFASEWLMLQALLAGAVQSAGGAKVVMCLYAGVLALTGGLAAACFVKAFGITFLAMPRSSRAQAARESPVSMTLPMIFLSGVVILTGLGAAVIFPYLVTIAGSVLGVDAAGVQWNAHPLLLHIPGASGVALSPVLVAALLGGGAIAAYAIVNIVGGKRRVSVNKTWDCGYYQLDSRNEYTGTAFSKPFRIAFSFFLLPYRKTEKIRDSFYHVKSFKYELFTTPVIRRYIYAPVLSGILLTAKFLRRLQPGSIHVYIAYIFVTIVVLIIFRNMF